MLERRRSDGAAARAAVRVDFVYEKGAEDGDGGADDGDSNFGDRPDSYVYTIVRVIGVAHLDQVYGFHYSADTGSANGKRVG